MLPPASGKECESSWHCLTGDDPTTSRLSGISQITPWMLREGPGRWVGDFRDTESRTLKAGWLLLPLGADSERQDVLTHTGCVEVVGMPQT